MTPALKPYIGSRDFFPKDTEFRNWMFDTQRSICLRYGYEEYATPLLEPLGLYLAKSSEELVNEQLYKFEDRSQRPVAIRPEMTPSLARMVVSRLNQLVRPMRWFSIANFMRYERPGRGRLREFFQLNVDVLGSPTPAADAETVMIAMDILFAYGAGKDDFLVRYSDRRLLESYFQGLSAAEIKTISRLLDKKEKLSESDFQKLLEEAELKPPTIDRIYKFVALKIDDLPPLAAAGELDLPATEHLADIGRILNEQGYGDSLRFDPGIVRGLDYYTGFVFEIYDNHPENRRALFGGGRYDRLTGIFGKEDLPAAGFGMGDVTLENFIRDHALLPAHLGQPTGVFLTLFAQELLSENLQLAAELRKNGIQVEVALECTKKFGKQFELAAKKNRRFALVLGESELQQKMVRVKDLATGDQKDVARADLASQLIALANS